MGGVRRRKDAAVRLDGSVPIAFLLGNRYSGYKQAINSSRDLKRMPSKLPKLFWGLSNEQRRLLATRMLEAGHSGAELEQAVRLAIWGEGSTRRSIRVPSRSQPWDNAHDIDGESTGFGPDGRPIVPERFRPREPFLVVAAEEVHTFGPGGRVEKPHERSDCGPARRRREIQEIMRARVQVQEEFLAGLEVDRREWHRYQTHTVKSNAVAAQRRRLKVRLAYGNQQSDDIGSDITSLASVNVDARQEKKDVARALQVGRQATQKANADSATMRRWEKEVLKTIRAEASKSLQTPGTSLWGHDSAKEVIGGEGCGRELARVLHELSVEYDVERQRSNLESTTCDEKNELGEREGASARPTASKEVPLGGGEVAVAQGQSVACEDSADDHGEQLLQPAWTAVASGDRAAGGDEGRPLQRSFPPARCEGDAMRRGEAGREEGACSDFAGAGVCDGDVEAGGPGSGEKERPAGRGEQGGDDTTVKSIVDKLLRTSSSVALAAARPLCVKPPPILEVPEDTHQVKLASRIQLRKQKRFPPPPRSKPERAFVGGGYRVNPATPAKFRHTAGSIGFGDIKTQAERAMESGIGHDDGRDGKSDSNAPLNPSFTGDGNRSRNFVDASQASCFSLLSTTPAAGEILNLEAVAVAAKRSTRGGSSSSSHASPLHRHPRNRFAPMTENELETFLPQPWNGAFIGVGNSATGIGRGSDTGVVRGRTGVAVTDADKLVAMASSARQRAEGADGRDPSQQSEGFSCFQLGVSFEAANLEGWQTSHSPKTGLP